jgi:TetR/AcrR family acrAB operon transcriptional repressor
MKRTKEQAAETRLQLLVAAEELFLEHGFENVSLDQIATAAGTSRGALHWHFVNKLGLLAAVGGKAQQPLAELADALGANETKAPLQLLADVIASMFSELHNDERRRSLYRVMMHAEISRKPGEKPRSSKAQEAIERILVTVNRKSKLYPPWTPSTAASALAATVSGILEEWALERSDLPLAPYGQVLTRTVIESFCGSVALEKPLDKHAG